MKAFTKKHTKHCPAIASIFVSISSICPIYGPVHSKTQLHTTMYYVLYIQLVWSLDEIVHRLRLP